MNNDNHYDYYYYNNYNYNNVYLKIDILAKPQKALILHLLHFLKT